MNLPFFTKPVSRFGEAVVLRTEQISKNMRRITFQSTFASQFDEHCAGGHIKLIVPRVDEKKPPHFESSDARARMRTYTIRAVRPSAKEFDVDFVMHGDHGVTGPWAAGARLGDCVAVSRPGSPKLITEQADWFLVVADMAAIPAAAAGLETLDNSALGDVYFEILSGYDRQEIRVPPGVKLHWIIKSEPQLRSDELIERVRGTHWYDGNPSVFVAGEFSTVAALRPYFRDERKTSKELTYISSYWKVGLIEPEHKSI